MAENLERRCRVSGESFLISPREAAYCEQRGIPLPTLSPRERLRNLLAYRNRLHLYRGTCCLTGSSFLSGTPANGGHRVTDVESWEQEKEDPLSKGVDYDFSRPFFEQFDALYRRVALPNLAVFYASMENSDFTHGITKAKDCYLLFSSTDNEFVMFSKSSVRCRDVLDSIFIFDSELCYECEDVTRCYNLRYATSCVGCQDSAFLTDCYNCKHCYGCSNLSNAEYCFYNKRLGRDAYEAKIRAIDLGSRSTVEQERERYLKWQASFFTKAFSGRQNDNSTGHYISNTKNCLSSYFVTDSEDIEHGIHLDKAKNCFVHAMFGNKAELIYNSVSSGENVYNCQFVVDCWVGVHDLQYCSFCCYGTNNCFGCVSLQKKSYCILNKHYTKQEYEELLPRVIRHMKSTGEYGEFFPPALSHQYFNESEAMEMFPLTRETAIERGYRWMDRDATVPPTAPGEGIPDNIRDVDDGILAKRLTCAVSGKAFRIGQPELKFYRKHGIPIPTVSPMERLRSRCDFFRIPELKPISCSRCKAQTVAARRPGERPVYCEACYRESIF